MAKFKLWQVGQSIPLKLEEANVGLEKNLEGWIESDPSLLPGELEIISRQMPVEGGRLDLLAMDPLGRYVVIEVKAGSLLSDTITQALYYAAQIDKYPFEILAAKVHDYSARGNNDLVALLRERGLEERDIGKDKEVLIYLVGTQRTAGIDTMLDYMAGKFRVPITAVTFDVFQLADGQRILVREISEADIVPPTAKKKPARSAADVKKVCALADQTGVGEEFRFIFEEIKKLGLHYRPYARSIMYAHPDHKTRMLFTVWAHQKPLKAYIGYEAFVDYYPVTTEQVAEALGPSSWRRLDFEQAKQLIAGLEKLISYGTAGE
jgi:hypothetical protein